MDDLISKQTVIDIVDSYSESQSNVEDVIQDIISDIVALPSVNPQPCEELDFVQPHKKFPVNLEACKMREATQEEREGIEQYIDSIVNVTFPYVVPDKPEYIYIDKEEDR